jgi:hypothetical protein
MQPVEHTREEFPYEWELEMPDGYMLKRHQDESLIDFGRRADAYRVSLRTKQTVDSRSEDSLVKATRVWGDMDSPFRRGEVPPLPKP